MNVLSFKIHRFGDYNVNLVPFGWSQGPNLYLQRKRVEVDVYDKVIIEIIYYILIQHDFQQQTQHYFQMVLQQNRKPNFK